jgi:hypothetical protein
MLHPDDVEQAGKVWAHSLATGPHMRTNSASCRAEGVYKYVHARAVPVMGGDGQGAGMGRKR